MANATDKLCVPVPDEFICPITLEVMVNPLSTRTGRSFERAAILDWISEGGKCPLTREDMRPSDLIPNHFLAAKIKKWRKEYSIKDPSEEDQKATDIKFVGFLDVAESNVSKRNQSRPAISLASAMSSDFLSTRSALELSARTTSGRTRSTRTTTPWRKEDRRSATRRIVASVLSAVSGDIDGM